MIVEDFLKNNGCLSVDDLTNNQVLEYFESVYTPYCDYSISFMVTKLCNEHYAVMSDVQKILRDAMKTGREVRIYDTYYEGASGEFVIELK